MVVWLDPYAPRTNALLGAAFSGGDTRKLARQIAEDRIPLGMTNPYSPNTNAIMGALWSGGNVMALAAKLAAQDKDK